MKANVDGEVVGKWLAFFIIASRTNDGQSNDVRANFENAMNVTRKARYCWYGLWLWILVDHKYILGAIPK